MIRCGECGLFVAAEEKTNRYGSHYSYYHCTRRRIDRQCRQPSVSKAILEAQFEAFLGSLTIPARLHAWALQCISQNDEAQQRTYEDQRHSFHQRLERTQSALANLTGLRVRDLINDEEFAAERRTLEMESVRIRQQLREREQEVTTFEPLCSLISFRNRALELFTNTDDRTKRIVIEITGSNPVLRDKILSVKAKPPFKTIAGGDPFPQMRAVVEDIRTLWISRDRELLETLDNIKRLDLSPENSSGMRILRRL
jgi:site-specific DNA recombinase